MQREVADDNRRSTHTASAGSKAIDKPAEEKTEAPTKADWQHESVEDSRCGTKGRKLSRHQSAHGASSSDEVCMLATSLTNTVDFRSAQGGEGTARTHMGGGLDRRAGRAKVGLVHQEIE